MPNIGGLTNFTVLQVQFVPQRRSVTVNLALKNEYSSLQFKVWILDLAFKTVKHKFSALYSCCIVQRFMGSVRDGLRCQSFGFI
jgi:hypothetical protein